MFTEQERRAFVALASACPTLRVVVTTHGDEWLDHYEHWQPWERIRCDMRCGGGQKLVHIIRRTAFNVHSSDREPAAVHGPAQVHDRASDAESDLELDGWSSAPVHVATASVNFISDAALSIAVGGRPTHAGAPCRHINWALKDNKPVMEVALREFNTAVIAGGFNKKGQLRLRHQKHFLSNFLKAFELKHPGCPRIPRQTFMRHYIRRYEMRGVESKREIRPGRPSLLTLEQQQVVARILVRYDFGNVGRDAAFVCRNILRDCLGFKQRQARNFWLRTLKNVKSKGKAMLTVVRADKLSKKRTAAISAAAQRHFFSVVAAARDFCATQSCAAYPDSKPYQELEEYFVGNLDEVVFATVSTRTHKHALTNMHVYPHTHAWRKQANTQINLIYTHAQNRRSTLPVLKAVSPSLARLRSSTISEIRTPPGPVWL